MATYETEKMEEIPRRHTVSFVVLINHIDLQVKRNTVRLCVSKIVHPQSLCLFTRFTTDSLQHCSTLALDRSTSLALSLSLSLPTH